jgi:hypothetical protein
MLYQLSYASSIPTRKPSPDPRKTCRHTAAPHVYGTEIKVSIPLKVEQQKRAVAQAVPGKFA